MQIYENLQGGGRGVRKFDKNLNFLICHQFFYNYNVNYVIAYSVFIFSIVMVDFS